MQAFTHTPQVVFGTHVRYVVPLFQRPYVWNLQDQWQPLWADVANLAERVLEASTTPGPAVPPHFLGAIVLDAQTNPTGFISVRHVVDGQQRLTTLQLLLDAAQEVAEQHGESFDAETLRVLVLNQPQVTQHPDEVFKVWPTDRDQDAFRAAMQNGVTVPPELAGSRIAQAHAYFVEQITSWAEPDGDPDKAKARLHALAVALQTHLKLVVIDLEVGDNAQVIFETLNHRGAPLLAADLVKNLVFQRAAAERLPVQALYDEFWRELDNDYWREFITQGRLVRPRIDSFLNYWLTMKLLREAPSDQIFTDFRDHVLGPCESLPALLAEIASDAKVFAGLDALLSASVEGTFVYRVVEALETRTVTPLLLWLLRWPEATLPAVERGRALQAVESWLVRRTLARLTSKDTNRALLELLKALNDAGPGGAGSAAEDFFAAQTADSRLWPDDALVTQRLESASVYTAITRARLRMILEALEDDLRSSYGEGQSAPHGLTVEHILPQAWKTNWPLDTDDPTLLAAREARVHRLGNLTLVSGKLNPALSNRPWTDSEGKGKRDFLLQHSNLKLNAEVVAEHPEVWNELDVDARTTDLTQRVLAIWPRPMSAAPTSVSPEAFEPAPVEVEPSTAPAGEEADTQSSHTGKYRELWRWLRTQQSDRIELTFEEVEDVLGLPLPPSARVHLPPWYGYDGSALGRAIRDAGWTASKVSLEQGRVTFVRADEADTKSAT